MSFKTGDKVILKRMMRHDRGRRISPWSSDANESYSRNIPLTVVQNDTYFILLVPEEIRPNGQNWHYDVKLFKLFDESKDDQFLRALYKEE